MTTTIKDGSNRKRKPLSHGFLNYVMTTTIKVVPKGSLIYNAKDHPSHTRGIDHNKKATLARVYSVYKISGGMAYCQSLTANYQVIEEFFPVATLLPYKPTTYSR